MDLCATFSGSAPRQQSLEQWSAHEYSIIHGHLKTKLCKSVFGLLAGCIKKCTKLTPALFGKEFRQFISLCLHPRTRRLERSMSAAPLPPLLLFPLPSFLLARSRRCIFSPKDNKADLWKCYVRIMGRRYLSGIIGGTDMHYAHLFDSWVLKHSDEGGALLYPETLCKCISESVF